MKTILKMENVKKSFGSGHNEIQALKGIDLAVNQSGSGSITSGMLYRRRNPMEKMLARVMK